jgi:EAL domain-containing protein (putative c-di-GMP-specific phosphodiesterase class I)/GGDEF domain-containing protein
MRSEIGLAPAQSAAEAADMDRRVRRLILRRADFSTAFQPIVELQDGEPVGFEALLRLPEDSGFSGPAEAFAEASATTHLVDLEMAAFEAHLSRGKALAGQRLFLNFSALSFLDARMSPDALFERVRGHGLEPQRVVLELTELVRIADLAAFGELLSALRARGFQIAVDDFGTGFSNLALLVELGPDYVKVDRSLVAGSAQHPRRRVFLESIGAFGRRINCSIVAEGVETIEDLETIRACGIALAQGWAIGRPAPEPALSEAAWRFAPEGTGLADAEGPVGPLAVPVEGVAPTTRVSEIIPLFEKSPTLAALPVLAAGRPIGLVTRTILFFHLGHQFGYSVWRDRGVRALLTAVAPAFDSLPASASLEAAAEVVRRRPADRRFDPVVILTERGDYHGLLPVDLLLAEMTRRKVDYALQANPLTGLPGNLVLARAAEWRLRSGQSFALGWVDIDDFKPFNDRYGFQRGDDVLSMLAGVLRTHLAIRRDDMLCHLGGDDFAFLASPEDVDHRARAVVSDFAARVPGLYDPEDRESGGITSVNRQGEERRFGILSLSVGITLVPPGTAPSYRSLVETVAETKRAAKNVVGPSVLINRRKLDV